MGIAVEILAVLWDYVLPFLVVLTVLIFVHELGHYWIARRCGVRVETFSIGFGPELLGWTDEAETRWKISAIPLGGYVKMFGEGEITGEDDVPRPLTTAERKVSFRHKSLGQRAAIVFAGPAANFIFAVIVLAGLYVSLGQPFTPAEIATVIDDSAAGKAGLQPGDVIVRIASEDMESFEQVQQKIRMIPEQTVELVVLRNGVEKAFTVTPVLREFKDRLGNEIRIGMLGVTREGKTEVRQLGFVSAIWQAILETKTITVRTLEAVGQIIIGSRSSDELGGPIKIAQMSGEFWKTGVLSLIYFTALISINLGLINLFPIPMLDGGLLLFFAFEAIRGRPLAERMQEYGFRIGLVLLISLMLFVIINDFVNLPFWNS